MEETQLEWPVWPFGSSSSGESEMYPGRKHIKQKPIKKASCTIFKLNSDQAYPCVCSIAPCLLQLSSGSPSFVLSCSNVPLEVLQRFL